MIVYNFNFFFENTIKSLILCNLTKIVTIDL